MYNHLLLDVLVSERRRTLETDAQHRRLVRLARLARRRRTAGAAPVQSEIVSLPRRQKVAPTTKEAA
jgi:hypothetical protein